MQYFVHGLDAEAVDVQLQSLAERHWAYMDAHTDRLVARGPTLSADGARHTGSVHVVEAATIDAARRFAFEEPNWLAGIYTSVTVTRFQSVREGTMWALVAGIALPSSATSVTIRRWRRGGRGVPASP